MIIFLYTIICAAFLNECNAVLGNLGGFLPTRNSTRSSVKAHYYQYREHPIQLACISSDSQTEFHLIEPKRLDWGDLVRYINNGKGLSLFFHGATNIVDPSNDLFLSFANEWYKESGNNICIVTYAYKSFLPNEPESVKVVDIMVYTERHYYVAEKVGDLVLGLIDKKRIKNLTQVDVSGFGFGAHIAGRTCKYLKKELQQRVRILLALDPIKTPLLEKEKDTIKSGYAEYVQVIHTSKNVGIWDKLGDVNVYINYVPDRNLGPLFDEHGIAFFIHVATSTKRLYLTAASNETGIGTVSRSPPNTTECALGVYGTLAKNHRGKKFGLSLKDRNQVFWNGIDSFGKAEIITGPQVENIPEEKLCPLCFAKEINTLLSCKHEMCNDCWREWKKHQAHKQPPHDKTCPLCRDPVTGAEKIQK